MMDIIGVFMMLTVGLGLVVAWRKPEGRVKPEIYCPQSDPSLCIPHTIHDYGSDWND